ncbi:MAG: galactokinase [Clostridiales bacterium]|nr:galactokinase [Clostridiales bacterium]
MINEKDYLYKISAAGRVNIIGEHIDYCGGKVFPAALSLRNEVFVRPNGTDKINISWTTLPHKISIDIENLEKYKNEPYANYIAGCVLIAKRAGKKILGCDMVQNCTVPFGSGLSSSAAIEVSTIAALAKIAGEEIDKVEIALLAQRAEREYAGVNCGIMDQFASACGKKNNAMLLDCKTLNCEFVPLNTGEYSLVIIDCNKPHSLIQSKYNERRAETDYALSVLKDKAKISCLAELSSSDFNKYSHLLSPKVQNRVLHVVEECKRVNLAQTAMKAGDMATLGELLNQSHASLSRLYEVTGREPDALAYTAQGHPACLGSRLTGGGFGGCTVSIVKTEAVSDFTDFVLKQYNKKIGYEAKCYLTEIADGLTVSNLA